MRRTLVAAGSFALLLGSATGASAAAEESDSADPPGHVVVADGLDNPRQLAWDGRSLLIAEGGQGGDDCSPPPPADISPADTLPADTAPPDTTSTGTTPTGTTPTGTTPAGADDDGTPDQGPGDAPSTPTDDTTLTDPTPPGADDDGTLDQGPGEDGDRPTSDTDGDTDGVCDGFTGGISAVDRPGRVEGDESDEAERVVDGLYSVETAQGAIGSDGVSATRFPDVLLIAQGEATPDALATGTETDDPEAETAEHLLIGVDGQVVPWVDLGAEETRQNPDRKSAPDSNPNAVIVVDPTPDDEPGIDEFALVADAGANTVWKVTPDFADLDEDGLPGYEVTVFAAYVPDDDPTTPDEFVPSALTQDGEGNVYVGGAGSLVPGAASVLRYGADGGEPTARWDGFTGINGLAVDPDGEHVYVSQVFGDEGPPMSPPEEPTATADDPAPTTTRPVPTPDEPAGSPVLPGNVVRFDTEDETYATFDVPLPSGLALGRDGAVYVSASSTSPADADDPATDEVEPGGQVWRFTFPEMTGQPPVLPVTTPPAVAAPQDAGTPPAAGNPGSVDDDGTGDQVPAGSGVDAGTGADAGTGVEAGTATDDTAPAGDDGPGDQGSGDLAP